MRKKTVVQREMIFQIAGRDAPGVSLNYKMFTELLYS